MSELPSGTVTFLFTDIEGSTRLLQQLGADLYGQVLADQRSILREAFDTFNGTEIDTQGDAFFASFPRATEAVAGVVQIQRALAEHDWPEGSEVRVRMGLHTGEPWLIEEGYVGMDIHRAARIAHVGHGGQVLLSETTTSLVRDALPEGVTLLDLGRHRLKDMRRPEYIRQLTIPGLPKEFPPLNSLEDIPSLDLSGLEPLRPPREISENPYRGLAAFHEDDAAFFFGRETFTAHLYETLEQRQLVAVVVGSSGSGKSSTVFAGLLPQLREAGDWLILSFRPGSHFFHTLATALVPILEPDQDETSRLFASQRLADGLRAGEISLYNTLSQVLEKVASANRVLLVIDQFEELYTLCRNPEVRQIFLDEVMATVDSESREWLKPFIFLLTLRADFMGQALTHRPFADALQEGSLMLGPMNREELQRAIEKPAELQGAAFEAGLVPRLLDDVSEEPGNLSLLEFALTLLWGRMDQGWMTHEAYELIGRVEGALSSHADEVFSGFNEKERHQVRKVFMQLVQPGEGTEDTRRVAQRDELVGIEWDLIQLLADERLVVTGLNEKGGETIEVVHEALIHSWGQMRKWMNVDREFRRWQEGLRAALRAWEESARDDGALLRGGPLAQAEDWLAERGSEIGDSEKLFIHASAAFQQERQQIRERRRRLIISGLSIGFIIAVVLSVVAFSQRNAAVQNAALADQNAELAEENAALAEQNAAAAEAEAVARSTQQALAEVGRAQAEFQSRLALSRNLALDATRNLTDDPQLSLLLALQAISQTYKTDGIVLPDALTALHKAVQTNTRLLRTVPAREGRKPYVSFHPDGTRLIVYYFRDGADPKSFPTDTLIAVYDVYSGKLLLELPAGMVAAHWPESGHVTMVDLLDDRTLELNIWETLEGTLIFQAPLEIPYVTVHDDIVALAISPDLNQFAMSLESGHTLIWDVESSELILDLFTDDFRPGEGVVVDPRIWAVRSPN